VECRSLRRGCDDLACRWTPEATSCVGRGVVERLLCLLAGHAARGPAERHVSALAVDPDASAEGDSASSAADDELTFRPTEASRSAGDNACVVLDEGERC
jgi:hypothetical protein